jgi:iron(III) transport system permease protein
VPRLRRFLIRWSPSLLVVGLVVLPLLGIAYGLAVPPPPIFGLEPEPLDQLIASSGVGDLLLRSLLLGGMVATTALVFGTWLAWLEQRSSYPGHRVLAIAALLPLAVPSYLVAAVLRHQLSPGGLIGGPLGLPPFTGMLPAAITLSVITTPLVQLVVGAALARSSAAEEEAARTLGARGWRLFRTVWLPRLRPAWAMSLLLVALYVVSDFGAVAVLDCPVLTWRLYQAMDLMNAREAALLGIALLIATVPLVLAARLVQGSHDLARQVANPRPAPRRPLGRGWWPVSFTLNSLLVGLGVLLPLFTLSGWVWDGLRFEQSFASIAKPVRHSLAAAGCGTLVVLLLALVPAGAASRRRSRGARLIDHGVYLTGALPGILLGGGLLLAALALSRLLDSRALYPWLMGSGVLLMLGYAARFLPEAFAPLKTAVLQLDPRQTETARTLGASPLRRLRSILLPALAPGTAAAAVLVFVAILKELPVTLLLGGAMGLTPLSYRVWERYEEAFLADAGLAGLLLLGLALAAVVLSLRFRRHV